MSDKAKKCCRGEDHFPRAGGGYDLRDDVLSGKLSFDAHRPGWGLELFSQFSEQLVPECDRVDLNREDHSTLNIGAAICDSFISNAKSGACGNGLHTNGAADRLFTFWTLQHTGLPHRNVPGDHIPALRSCLKNFRRYWGGCLFSQRQ